MSHIARELKIKPATLSRTSNDLPKISLKKKKLVLNVAGKLNYRPNRNASPLRSGRSQVIGVIIPGANINFFGSVEHGIESLANNDGYNILIFQSNESPEFEKKALKTFIETSVDGIIASIAKETTDFAHYNEIRLKNIPPVLFDRANDKINVSSVVFDDHRGAFLATEHLIMQGYKRIAHISGQQHIGIFKERLKGYKDALAHYKIQFDSSLVERGNVSIDSGRQAAKRFLSMSNPPDAIFAMEDFTALGVIKELKAQGIKIPEQFGVIGFANKTFGEHITPSLSTIDQQTIKMGKKTFKLLLTQINEKDVKERVKMKIVLDAVPISRQSSHRVNANN